MSDPVSERLRVLHEKLEAKQLEKLEAERSNQTSEKYTNADLGWRMVIDLVVGMAFGISVGLGLDRWLNTMPVFLVIFSLLGFAAGVRVMLETAASHNKKRDNAPLDE